MWCMTLSQAIGERMIVYRGADDTIRGIYGGEKPLGLPLEQMMTEGNLWLHDTVRRRARSGS